MFCAECDNPFLRETSKVWSKCGVNKPYQLLFTDNDPNACSSRTSKLKWPNNSYRKLGQEADVRLLEATFD
ncbi:hypothetical protein M8C21_031317 [Ambrosia artemisiifolia]|uniref:Uncharacterized protein n=1 Tax=Ambrosia artemisiifolia TaxID=4212 RepID=A0AAD5GE54_AMBAR|nr:hypothetical protein M8C21_031317 [Ambrosia artemisiifolia]